MNKFKKILLGALSVLTLGLFVVSTTEVNAAVLKPSSCHGFSETHDFYSKTEDYFTISSSGHGASNSTEILSFGGNHKTYNFDSTRVLATNETGESFTAYASPSSTRTWTLSVPEGYTSLNVSLFVTNENTSGSRTATIPTANVSGDVKLDGTKVEPTSGNVVVTLDKASALTSLVAYKIDLTITGTVAISVGNTLSFLGVYADGESNVYTATFDVNGGILDSAEDITVSKDAQDKTITLYSAPTKEKYTFSGWSDGTNLYLAGSTITLDSDKNFKAIWKINDGLATYVNFSDEDLIDSAISDSLDIAGSIFTILSNARSKITTVGTQSIDNYSFTQRLSTGASAVFADSKGLLKVSAPSSGILRVYAMSSGNDERILNLYDSNGNVIDNTFATTTTACHIYNIPSDGYYYLGANTGGFSIFYVDFNESIIAPILEQQEPSDGSGSSLRYIATVYTNNPELIVSWKATFTLVGKKAPYVTDDFTTLYSAVGGNNGKTAKNNTYYLVVTLDNIPSKYNTRLLTCKFTITLNGLSPVESNVIEYTINVKTTE